MRDQQEQRDQQARDALLRTAGGIWEGIRRCLLARDIDPTTTTLVNWFPDDVCTTHGEVVSSDGRKFAFDYEHPPREESGGEFGEWRELAARRH